MDLVAIVSVIATAAVGLTAALVTLYGIHRTARTARATQVQQRRANAYLEVLRLVEAKAYWVTVSAENHKIAAQSAFGYEYGYPLPPSPPLDATATMRAQVAAFGSAAVKDAFSAWLTQMNAIDRSYLNLDVDIIESGGAPPDFEQVQPLLDRLTQEEQARKKLAEAIAADLERE